MKAGIVLFNLGGPDGLDAVEPFLRNLFSDPAIIGLPGLLRRPLARFIARRRAPYAKSIYGSIGGRSPIVPETLAQARALETALSVRGIEAKAVVAMRYWRPRADEAAAELAAFKPDRIVLLPLYPQFSTTTTASSVADWADAARTAGLSAPSATLCCFPAEAGLVRAYAELLRESLARVPEGAGARALFSAHGLPERVVAKGDPYPAQVEATSRAIVAAAGVAGLDWKVTYQSRVGPLKWIGPDTDAEIEAAAKAGLVPVVLPVSFVSEHSETLYELDQIYRDLALSSGAPAYIRVPAAGTHPAFIAGLAELVAGALRREGVAPGGPWGGCGTAKACPCRTAA